MLKSFKMIKAFKCPKCKTVQFAGQRCFLDDSQLVEYDLSLNNNLFDSGEESFLNQLIELENQEVKDVLDDLLDKVEEQYNHEYDYLTEDEQLHEHSDGKINHDCRILENPLLKIENMVNVLNVDRIIESFYNNNIDNK